MKTNYGRNNTVCSGYWRKIFLMLFILAGLLNEKSFAQCQVSIAQTNVSCSGGYDGSIAATPSGGTPAYTYMWSSGSTSQTVTGLGAGTYTITVTDAIGCTVTSAVAITQPPALDVIATSSNATCGMNNGVVVANVTGGTIGYTYTWSCGTYTDTTSNLPPGLYVVTVTDGNGCTASSSVSIIDLGSPSLSVTSAIKPSQCVLSDGSMEVSASGGSTPYVYTWSNGYYDLAGQTTSSYSGMVAGSYSITVIDVNGCTAETNATLTCPSPIKYNSCGSDCAGEIDATEFACGGGSFQWSNSATTAKATGLCNGTYTVTITHVCTIPATVMSFVMTDSCDLVWPGDAERDLVADNNDLLAIGVGYGSTGTVRPNASILWQGEGVADWGITLLSGVDYKHVDCNGDGTINSDDTTAIVNNYGMTHDQKIIAPEYLQGTPDLAFIMPVDTTDSGSPITVPISLGTSANPVSNFYGIAFTINYDPTIVDSNSISLSLAGSWLGTEGADMIKITKNFGAAGKLHVGVTRIDHQNINGYGVIGQTTMIMKDDIVPKLLQGANPTKTLQLSFSDIKAIQTNETVIPVNQTNDSVVINILPTGIKNMPRVNDVSIYPVPAKGQLTVVSGNSKILKVTLANVIGQNLMELDAKESTTINIDVQALPQGIYYLSVLTDKGRFVQKIYVER